MLACLLAYEHCPPFHRHNPYFFLCISTQAHFIIPMIRIQSFSHPYPPQNLSEKFVVYKRNGLRKHNRIPTFPGAMQIPPETFISDGMSDTNWINGYGPDNAKERAISRPFPSAYSAISLIQQRLLRCCSCSKFFQVAWILAFSSSSGPVSA